jgi:hypothetical protein
MDRQPAVRISMEVATDGVTNPPEGDYCVSGQMACKKWTPLQRMLSRGLA